MPNEFIITGGGGHARVLVDLIQRSGKNRILGYTDFNPVDDMDIPYLGNDSAIESYAPKDILLVNGVGSVNIPRQRGEVYRLLTEKGYIFASVVHDRSIVSVKASLSDGVQVMGGAVINAGTIVRENVIVNTAVIIEHDCNIGAHTHLASGVILSGGVSIGAGCHIGTGTIVIQGINIGKDVLIGAGSLIIHDIPSGVKAYGAPASIMP